MVNIIVGAVAIVLGLWLMFVNWWSTVDLLRTVFPILLAAYGLVALMAGLKKFGRKPSGTEEQ